MERDAFRLRQRYSGLLKVESFGQSRQGRRLYCICLGNPKARKKLLVDGGIHGREWLNIQLFMAILEEYCRKYQTGIYRGIPYRRLFQKVSLFVVPVLNPDGVQISQTSRPRWKANARGIDLNRNFEPGFGRGRETRPGSQDYGGEYPYSEPETKALLRLLEAVRPCGVLNYHEAGPLIYYTSPSAMLDQVAGVSHYPMVRETEGAYGSFGDWLESRGIPYCTLETCRGAAPVKHWQYYETWYRNRKVWLAAALSFW